MPLINGQKMACEPCIRGHRSTKCTHANERLMVPVRKPGRPLSSCPHPSSRTCSCAAVTAAIPRKQRCRCGTSQAVPAETTADRDVSSGRLTPPSPSKAAVAAFRVQKQGPKSAPSRKQSVDPAGLERMDSNQLNILPAYNGMQQAVPDMPLYGTMGLTPAESPFSPEPAMFPMFPYPMQSQLMAAPAPSKPVTSGHGTPPTNASTTVSAAPVPAGGCCGGRAGAAQSRTATQQMSTQSPAINGAAETEASASCTAADARDTEAQAKPLSALGIAQPPNAVLVPPFEPSMAVPNAMYPSYFAQPTVFSYPPQLGSFLQPLQPEQWRQLMTTVNFGQTTVPGAFDMARQAPFSPPSTANGASWTSHQCSCGDSCQCIGCAAHPYNKATQNYVRSAWNAVVADNQKVRAHGHDHANAVNGNINGGHERSASGASNGVTTPVTGQAEGTISPVAPQTPTDETSGVSEEQTLSANDFFFVSYPFGEACAGETASCPCGDDCQCIGCVIHNNPHLEPAAESSLCL